MKLKLNKPEFSHDVIGTPFLVWGLLYLLDKFAGVLDATQKFILICVVWVFWYIFVDQILHVLVKKESISIVNKR
jgi:hypothetical protein